MRTELRSVSIVLAAITGFALVPDRAAAQATLLGTYVRYLHVGPTGTMINDAAFQSMQYGETAGGTPSCDLYYPGTPQESFTIQATPMGGMPVSMSNDGNGFGPTDVATTAGPTVAGRTITWSGRGAMGGVTVDVTTTFSFAMDDRVVRLTIVLTNAGTTPLTDVYYLRNGDPDHGECSIGFDFATENDVRRQPPVDGSALATAGGGDLTTPDRFLVIGFGAHDTRARVHTGGFTNYDAVGEWTTPTDGGGLLADEAVDVIFREATLAPGASTTFEMFYVWGTSVAQVEMRFDELGFPTAPCMGLAEGAMCTTSLGRSGLCRGGRCCTGCWDGTRCTAGTTPAQCGIAGAMCASCVDPTACTNDVCTAGVCSNPPAPSGTVCNDGLFCTLTDRCNATAMCIGMGARCDDAQDCTIDSCNEMADTCTNMGRPDGTMCTAAGAPGTCRSAACCPGCWNGTSCLAGTTAAACGVVGGLCASCVDGDLCTTDVCTTGACSNPDAPSGTMCNDGMFCTSIDTCDGAGTCNGGGVRCNDGATCTTDTCDEATDMCVFTPTAGCIIGGACVAEGMVNPAYPCLVCDRARNPTDWSPRAAGTLCGMDMCMAGRLYPARTCNATGMCVMAASMPCPSGVCMSSTACETTCATTGCAAGEYCTPGGTCAPTLANGTTCVSDAACTSGQCTDGVCCNDACDASCVACNVPMNVGTCTPVPAGTDPAMECAMGECDGAGGCTGPDAGPPPIDAAPGEDSGPPAMVDSGPRPDARAGVDSGTMPPMTGGGCGCGVPGTGSDAGLGALALLGLALALRRRRA
jgi:hypothetical protein